jgi:hypothetical protein
MIVLVILAALQSALATQSHGRVIGEAFGLKNNDLLYSETHCEINDTASEVIYRHGDGTPIAYKKLDYQSGHTTPSFVQHNIHAKEKIEVSFDQQAVSMSVMVSGSRESEKRLPVTDIASAPVVIDAGFDGFIRNNWDKLVSGETLEFQFPFASRASMIRLQVESSVCSYETETDRCFTLQPSNWFLRMLSSPVELGYDSLSRLTRYRGLSNINDENGKGQVVDIRYRYQGIAAAACNIDPVLLTDNATEPRQRIEY